MFLPSSVPLQPIVDSVLNSYGVKLFILRLDLTHRHISGNKWFKLYYNIQKAQEQQNKTLVTFGGAFSNHIAATAAAGKEYNFKTIGIIRGEPYEELNPTLQFAEQCGMELHYVSRTLYGNKEALYAYVENAFKESNNYLIPEGGSNQLGVKGCTEILKYVSIPFNYVCCAAGTGATLAGITLSLQDEQKALGFQVLKAESYIAKEVNTWLFKLSEKNKTYNWHVNEDYHFGGYAKSNKLLRDFMVEFYKLHQISLDAIYTGKMMYGIYDLVKNNFFKSGETIVAIHTGGLQGNAGFYNE